MGSPPGTGSNARAESAALQDRLLVFAPIDPAEIVNALTLQTRSKQDAIHAQHRKRFHLRANKIVSKSSHQFYSMGIGAGKWARRSGRISRRSCDIFQAIRSAKLLPILFLSSSFLQHLLYKYWAAQLALGGFSNAARIHRPIALLWIGGHRSAEPSTVSSKAPLPTPRTSALQFISPASSSRLDPESIKISALPAPQLNQSWTGPGLPQIKPSIPAQLLTRGQNPAQLLALNQLTQKLTPNDSHRAKAEPIPTAFPDAHFENIPTNWPELKFLLIDKPPTTNVAPDPKRK